MTAAEIIAACQATGVTLSNCEGMIRCAPSRNLSPELRATLIANKSAVLTLLAATSPGEGIHEEDSRATRQADMSRQWSLAYDRLHAHFYPLGGRSILSLHNREYIQAWDAAEAEAERVSLAYVACEVDRLAFLEALEMWVEAVLSAIRCLGDVCHLCGRPALAVVASDRGLPSIVVVVSDDGHRTCRKCLGGGQ